MRKKENQEDDINLTNQTIKLSKPTFCNIQNKKTNSKQQIKNIQNKPKRMNDTMLIKTKYNNAISSIIAIAHTP